MNVVLGCQEDSHRGCSKLDLSARECVPIRSGKWDATGIVCNIVIDVSPKQVILKSGGISSVVTQPEAMDREASPICQSS